VAKHTFKSDLSVKGIEKLKKDLLEYKRDFNIKVGLFVERLAQEGVMLAKVKIAEKDAVYTGELYNSMNIRKGDAVFDGAKWIIYTDCPWAIYVEFGTGLVGSENQHPNPNLANWKYDINEHGEKGWFYYKDGEWHWTKGMPSRPFMYETALELQLLVPKIAREVFG
jgi:hypothetical protein